MNSLSQVAIIAIIFFACYKTIEIFVRRRERLNTENMQFLLSSGKLNFGKYTPLRLGCAIAGIGLGLLIAFMIVRLNFGYINGDTDWYIRNMISTIYGASSLLFGGVALIICFLIERSENKK